MANTMLDMAALFAQREAERYALHTRFLNEQMVRVLKTIGYDAGFCRGAGQYLYDRDGTEYLDLLSGFGVFAIGRNHPAVRQALQSVLDGEASAFRDVALLNAAAALIVAGKVKDLKEGVALGTKSLDSGAAAAKLKHLVAVSNG